MCCEQWGFGLFNAMLALFIMHTITICLCFYRNRLCDTRHREGVGRSVWYIALDGRRSPVSQRSGPLSRSVPNRLYGCSVCRIVRIFKGVLAEGDRQQEALVGLHIQQCRVTRRAQETGDQNQRTFLGSEF